MIMAEAAIDVSVVTPTFHRELEVVESVRSALAQPGVNLEVIVLDDSREGSAREGIEGLGDPRVRYVHRAEPSGGRPALVRNEGAHMARGRFLHFLDDDDKLAEGALAALVGALERAPNEGVAYGVVLPFGEDEARVAHETEYFARARAVSRMHLTRMDLVARLLFGFTPLVCSACMVRRELALAIGGFDPDVAYCEDVHFYLRAIREGGFVFLDRPVVRYRTSADSLMKGSDQEKLIASYRVIYDKYLRAHGKAEFYALKILAKAIT